jgi:hypothetical protein
MPQCNPALHNNKKKRKEKQANKKSEPFKSVKM